MDLARNVPPAPRGRGPEATWRRGALLAGSAVTLLVSAILAAAPGPGHEAHAAPSEQVVPTSTTPPGSNEPSGQKPSWSMPPIGSTKKTPSTSRGAAASPPSESRRVSAW